VTQYRPVLIIISSILLFLSQIVSADVCPSPKTSSLHEGIIPAPWLKNPFSQRNPQPNDNAAFSKATILVLFGMGKGIICTYQVNDGYYAIWRQVPVAVPWSGDYAWVRVQGGYVCGRDLLQCLFYPVSV
jgi:hypothetical protein